MKLKGSLLPALVWMACIWVMSSIPSRDIPSIKLIGFDKLAHVSVYAILGLLVNSWLKARKLTRLSAIIVYAVLILTATFDEYHQYYIPGRSVSVYDLFANTTGLLIPLCIYLLKHDRSK